MAGLIIGFIPVMPNVSLHPDLVFLIFLPLLLNAVTWNTSWKRFLANEMLIEVVTVRRKELQKLRSEKIYSNELIRNKEWELDLEEARLNE